MATNPAYSAIGKRLPKQDSESLVTGEAKYLDDLKLPGMLYGRIFRSPHPHALIKRINTAAAESLPGVKAVITADDTEKVKFCHLPVTPNKLALNDEKVRFVGDEVAAVAAVDWETADKALGLIEVEYELLPAVFDPLEAMQPGAPQIYEDCDNNIPARIARNFGDVDKGFAEADYIFEDTYKTPLIPACSIEPHCCIASFDHLGNLTFWVSTQNPNNYQKALSQVLKIPQNRIRVIRPKVGGAFGNKSVILPMDPIAAFLAKKAGQPVKLVNSREEEFTTTRGRYAMVIQLKTGVSRDGKLLAREAKVITNNGAYNNKATGISLLTSNRIGNLYRIPNSRTEAIIVYTNTQYGGAMRGWGGPQAHFAVESQMDTIAEKLGMDPLELRLKNANQTGDTTPWGWLIASCGLSECLEQAAEKIGWQEKRNLSGLRGVGIASVLHTGSGSAGTHGAGNFSEVLLKVYSDGAVGLIVGESDIGQGSDTVLSQIASEVLGVPLNKITVASEDTNFTPPSMGTWGSKVTFISGNAVKMAAEDARLQLAAAAKRILEVGDDARFAFVDSRIHLEGSGQSIGIEEASNYCVQKFGKPVTAKAVYEPPNANPPDPKTGFGNYCPTYAFGAQAAEVEVDPETGRVKVLRIVAAHDVGKAINPLLVEGQIQGGVAQGMGYALFEGAREKDGRVVNDNFTTNKILNATEMPWMEEILVETLDPHGPFNAKGIGEPPLIATAPAIANAVYNATGVRIKELPITPDKILRELIIKREAEGCSSEKE
ncbi:xanthine dehydrogenase family protein molybdopterin-binding subunit [Desulfoferula mesophila]|uniref:Dehydrogenase n=1 Tax=Desulfoferula mesophila TaxID=3058419 RepID=A0AAU9EJJ5_9BACT|nr:dehydrogenase [Desulfoferula mesophilus]